MACNNSQIYICKDKTKISMLTSELGSIICPIAFSLTIILSQ